MIVAFLLFIQIVLLTVIAAPALMAYLTAWVTLAQRPKLDTKKITDALTIFERRLGNIEARFKDQDNVLSSRKARTPEEVPFGAEGQS